MCKTKPVKKVGYLYSEIKTTIRPFDVLLFKGDATFSKIISALEKYGNKIPNSGEFTHAGMVVSSEILTHPKILPDRLYLLESTVGGKYGNKVPDINGKSVIGVQIRDLEAVINAADKSNDTLVACGKLINNPLNYLSKDDIKPKMNAFCESHLGDPYDANVYDLLSSIFPKLRKYRSKIAKICHTQDWHFCSEIVTMVYKQFGVYPPEINEKDVVPRDIIYPWADIDNMPKIIDEIIYITTPIHYKK